MRKGFATASPPGNRSKPSDPDAASAVAGPDCTGANLGANLKEAAGSAGAAAAGAGVALDAFPGACPVSALTVSPAEAAVSLFMLCGFALRAAAFAGAFAALLEAGFAAALAAGFFSTEAA